MILAASRLRTAIRLVVAALGVLALLVPALAETPSGLPLPRFVTTRSNEINVRVGPGTKYDIAWVFKVAGTPVEIIAEFDVWRKIRDVDGDEGWVHQTMLTGERGGYVAPWLSGDPLALRANAADDAGVNAWVNPGFPVKIQSCDGAWCAVVATDHPKDGRAVAYNGYVPEADLWGVYQGEKFD